MVDIPFGDASPTRILWVDANAAPGGDGSSEKPLNSINWALAKAHPGTAIMVKAGDYNEAVMVPRTVSGTEDAPIWLISADGPQAAHIIAPEGAKAGIGGGGTENFIVDGFWVSGGKNGIQFSQNGTDYTDTIKNIVIRNNVVDGVVQDGVKANGGDNVFVYNNVLSGGVDENIDFLGIVHGLIANNEVSGNQGTSAAILVKGGSDDILIANNYIHDTKADGISVGGWLSYDLPMRAGYDTAQATNITVTGNVVESVGKRPLAFYGAADSVATNNYLKATDKYFTVVQVDNANETMYGKFASRNITVTDNQITRTTKVSWVNDTSTNVKVDKNDVAVKTDVNQLDLSHLSLGVLKALAAKGTIALSPATLAALDAAIYKSEHPTHEAPASSPPSIETPASAPEAPAESTKPVEVVETPPSPTDKVMKAFDALAKAAVGGATTTDIRDGKGTDANDYLRNRAETLAGGKGDDSYMVGTDFKKVVEKAGEGFDTILGSSRYFAAPANVEAIDATGSNGAILQGNAGDNVLKGTGSDDVLIGGGGNNILAGRGGNDSFIIGADDKLTIVSDYAAGDTILIAANPFASFQDLLDHAVQIGTKTLISLDDGRSILLEGVLKSALTAGMFEFGATGGIASEGGNAPGRVNANAAFHTAVGTDTAEMIYGKGDTVMSGGKGDDRYVVSGPNDHVVEHANEGIDTVLLYTSKYAIEANVENVKVKGTADTIVIGNNLANVIYGGVGKDTITGGYGADLLAGGKGADVFVYTSAKDAGDHIVDFTVGVDHLDVKGLLASQPSAHLFTVAGAAGLQIYLSDGATDTLLATLDHVVGNVALADLLIA